MNPIEFETELSGSAYLPLPPDIAQQLPSSGHATVVVFVQDDPEDREWRQAAYKQFAKDDSPEDAVYDRFE